MKDFKNIKYFNCSLDFSLTRLLTVGVMISFNAFLKEVIFFHWPFDDIDVESASKYVARKHRISTTMNSSGSRVIHIVIVLCCLPLPSVWHLSSVSKSSQNWRQELFQKWKLYWRTPTPSWLLSKSGVIRIFMRVLRLINGKPFRCYYTCGYMIFMTWVISLNNLTVVW